MSPASPGGRAPFSQPAIDAINQYLPYPIGRTVDYTDLVAFLIIPACVIVAASPARFSLPGHSLRRIAAIPILATTMLGVMATSPPPQVRSTSQARVPVDAVDFNRDEVVRIIAEVTTRHGLKCGDCRNPLNGGHYEGKGVLLNYVFFGEKTVSFVIDSGPGGLFGPNSYRIAMQLGEDLKSGLSSLRTDVEYIEH